MQIAKIRSKYRREKICSCCDKGCKLCLKSDMPRVILDGDKFDSDIKTCDCIIFQSDGMIFLVELKTTDRIDPDDIVEKFENSGKTALTIAEKYSLNDIKIKCILLSKTPRILFNIKMKKKRPVIGGKDRGIQKGNCNCWLNDFICK